jgi:hypothetical protein
VQEHSVQGMGFSAASAHFREAGRPLTLTFRSPTAAERDSQTAKQKSGETTIALDAKMKQVCEFCFAHLKSTEASTMAKTRAWHKKFKEKGAATMQMVSPGKEPGRMAAQRNAAAEAALLRSTQMYAAPDDV